MARPDQLLNRRMTAAPAVEITAAAATATTAQLSKGVYIVTSDIDIFFLQGASGVTASATGGSTSIPLWATTYLEIEVEDPDIDGYVAVIRQGGTDGTVWFTKPQP